MTATEYVILVDGADNEIGIAPKLHAHEEGLLHRAFSVFVYRHFTVNGAIHIEWLLQQRAHQKYHSAGLWTNTCCSHPKPSEPVLVAARRRLTEEMGLCLTLRCCGQFKYKAAFENGLIEHEIDHVLLGLAKPDDFIQANPLEVASYRWVETAILQLEIEHSPSQFTPWFKAAWYLALHGI